MPRKKIREADESAKVENDKKATRRDSDMRMDDMAIEWVEQVLSFLPITEVYKCRSVCKKWQAAANYVIKGCSTMTLVLPTHQGGSNDRDAEHENRIVLKTAAVYIVRQGRARQMIWRKATAETDAAMWIERLKPFVRLKTLIFIQSLFEGLYFSNDRIPVVHHVVRVNASSLTLLHMSSLPLPFDPHHPLVFSNLRDLECDLLLDPDLVTACPRLEKLWTRQTSVKVLQKLPAETMTSLDITDLDIKESHEEIEQLVAALSRLTRLKSLTLWDGYAVYQWTELHDRALSKLFRNMKELEQVDITFPQFHQVNVDEVIETLVQNNQSVCSVTMMEARITNASFRSLSRLTGLQFLAIRSYKWHNEITTEGILSLLRGGSQNVLRNLELNMGVMPDLDRIRAEGKLMLEETGRTFDVEAVSVPIENAISYTLYIDLKAVEAAALE